MPLRPTSQVCCRKFIGCRPQAYAVAGFALVEQECDGFFDNLATLNQNANFVSDILVAAIPIMPFCQSHARTITKSPRAWRSQICPKSLRVSLKATPILLFSSDQECCEGFL